ncbi:hypothetical protein GYMLUDRAFT_83444 [Collybiopsis luxurians FD-317 M1]|uniref:Zn(2)-C6 fungal-type domain-containing protein n=1 Tax=Collybiopsis luxurians FD-317 M1 TaxID=944289 RepID=A0A0D0C7D7_9AGAR|nr:hypothetical protein GYMLUDRAFT_83444 [Collybiopsis luxurians FD-317 M1]
MSYTNSHQYTHDDLNEIPYKQYPLSDPSPRISTETHFIYNDQLSPTRYEHSYESQSYSHPYFPPSHPDQLYPSEVQYHSHHNMDLHWPPYSQNRRLGFASNAANSNYHHGPSSLPSPQFTSTSMQPAQPPSQSFHSNTPGHVDAYHNSQRTLAGSLDPATGVFYRTPEHPRLRTAQACEKCRTRKAKCSGEHPSCKRCLTRGLICEYAKEGRVRGPNKPKSKASPTNTSESSSLPARQSQSSPPAPAKQTPGPTTSLPRRYVSPSILPPSMSSSLSSPSSPRVGIPFDSFNPPISSTSTSDRTAGAHRISPDSVSYGLNQSEKPRPPNLELSGVSNLYRPNSRTPEFLGSQVSMESALAPYSHIPHSQSYSDTSASSSIDHGSSPTSATTSTSFSDISSPPAEMSALVVQSDVAGGEFLHPESSNEHQRSPDRNQLPFYSELPEGSALIHDMQRPRSHDSYSGSNIVHEHWAFNPSQTDMEAVYSTDVDTC